ncbi:Serine--tRNA ligase [Actinidia chinensis var. chinensis]|uniref:Serine--tRNA ligase n=1 Tax=Actinidia chinensis var. chinensis TaxID=1590841 RepID=A0A2R6QHD5_ACTCC|nr:Serine--tRNA ligase [Actinidia chinensis var. chinensis]
MGLPLATLQALKLFTAAYFFSAVMSILLPYEFKGQVTMGKLIAEEIIFYMGKLICIRFMVAPPKGSAAAETNPSEPLLAALEESTPRSIVQYLAYLDLCMVCENNVDTWRRAAFCEETGDWRNMGLGLRVLKGARRNRVIRKSIQPEFHDLGCLGYGIRGAMRNEARTRTSTWVRHNHFEACVRFSYLLVIETQILSSRNSDLIAVTDLIIVAVPRI